MASIVVSQNLETNKMGADVQCITSKQSIGNEREFSRKPYCLIGDRDAVDAWNSRTAKQKSSDDKPIFMRAANAGNLYLYVLLSTTIISAVLSTFLFDLPSLCPLRLACFLITLR
jgi:hypothetical protein